MKPATPTAWKTEPLPQKRTTIPLDRGFSAEDMTRIRLGVVPAQMEDKWFIYWTDDTLFFHRSWTGFCVYVVHFAVEGDTARMTHAEVNRDPAQYTETDDERDRQLISYLVDVLLLRRDCAFPTDDPASERAALLAWSAVGRAVLGQHPDDENSAQ